MRRFRIALASILLPILAILAIAQFPTEQAKTAAITALKGQAPGVLFFNDAGKVSRIYGVKFATGTDPLNTAETFMSQYGSIFEPGDSTFAVEGTQDVMNGKFTAVYFKQVLAGHDVDLAHLTVLVKNEPGYPAVLANSATKSVEGIFGGANISSKRAVSIARGQAPSLSLFNTPKLVIFAGETETHLAWTFLLDNGTLANQKRFQVFVDAENGTILEWRDKVIETDVNGNVQGMATPGLRPDQANNPPVTFNLNAMFVSIAGGGSAYTNALGNFTITNPGTTAVNVTSDMRGRWSRAVASQGTLMTQTQSVTPPGPTNFAHNGTPAQFNTSQLNALRNMDIVHDFAKTINATYPGIDVQFPANVNINQTCNASYNGTALNFYAAGGGCPNTAYSTVIYHEYGHFIIDSGHPTAAGDYHEGMADVTSALLTNNSWLGEDFHGQGTGPLRNAINSVNYPCTGEAHTCGQVISGAFWHTLEAMKASMPEPQALAFVRSWYLNSILLQPSGINPGVTIDVLTLDDNDSDIYNGTPHYAQIAQGFGMKNLDAPDIDWVNIAPVLVPSDFQATRARATFLTFRFSATSNVGTPNPATFVFHYKINGNAWQNQPVPLSGGTYTAQLTTSVGDAVLWYASILDTQGRLTNYPRGGEGNARLTTVGTGFPIVLDDPFETDLGWSIVNTSLASGAWTRANPNGSNLGGEPANPEDDSDDAGAQCWFTGQAAVGAAVGTADVDGGPTTLTSPLFDMSSGNHVIEYRRWFFNDDGDDSMRVEISNNNGSSWTLVENVMNTPPQNLWTRRRIAVSNYLPPTAQMRIRFSTSDNPNNSVTEAGLDHLVITKISTN